MLKFISVGTALLAAELCSAQTDVNLVYGTYLGGGGDEFFDGRTMARDSQGSPAFAGSTLSNFMETSSDAYQAFLAGGSNGFNTFIVRVGEDGMPFLHLLLRRWLGKNHGPRIYGRG